MVLMNFYIEEEIFHLCRDVFATLGVKITYGIFCWFIWSVMIPLISLALQTIFTVRYCNKGNSGFLKLVRLTTIPIIWLAFYLWNKPIVEYDYYCMVNNAIINSSARELDGINGPMYRLFWYIIAGVIPIAHWVYCWFMIRKYKSVK